jgi:hypothetical protein
MINMFKSTYAWTTVVGITYKPRRSCKKGAGFWWYRNTGQTGGNSQHEMLGSQGVKLRLMRHWQAVARGAGVQYSPQGSIYRATQKEWYNFTCLLRNNQWTYNHVICINR